MFKRRKAPKNRKAARKFNKGVHKTKKPNMRAAPMRGGFRF